MAYFNDFAGMSTLHFAFSILSVLDSGSWIVDSGTSNHMCNDFSLLQTPNNVQSITPVYLLDGSIRMVHHIGDVSITKRVLTSTLHILNFQYNFLSVNKLSKTSFIKFFSILTFAFYRTYKLKRF